MLEQRRVCKKSQNTWNTIPQAIWWTVWLERNGRIFEGHRRNLHGLKQRCLILLAFWCNLVIVQDVAAILDTIQDLHNLLFEFPAFVLHWLAHKFWPLSHDLGIDTSPSQGSLLLKCFSLSINAKETCVQRSGKPVFWCSLCQLAVAATPTDESKSLVSLCHGKSHCLSKETIISEAKVLQLETDTCSKVSAVVEFFQNHGFSATQVKKIIRQRPKLLASKVDKTLKPKLNFLQSIGFSEDECSMIISHKPCILGSSVEKQLNPSFDFLKTFMGSRVRALAAIKQFPQILFSNVSHSWKQTVQVLGQIGIPDSQVSEFIKKSPIILSINPQKMSEVGLRLKEMGFDVTSPAFRRAFSAMSILGHSKMEMKLETYRSLGFSDGEILNMFRSQPNIMFYTEENIRAIVAFYVDRLHFSLSILSKRPNFLLCSLKRSLIPRCSVMQVLWSRGIISKIGKLYAMLRISEKDLLQKYVTEYEAEVPELQAAYRGELMFDEYSFHLHEIRQMSMSKGSSPETKAA